MTVRNRTVVKDPQSCCQYLRSDGNVYFQSQDCEKGYQVVDNVLCQWNFTELFQNVWLAKRLLLGFFCAKVY